MIKKSQLIRYMSTMEWTFGSGFLKPMCTQTTSMRLNMATSVSCKVKFAKYFWITLLRKVLACWNKTTLCICSTNSIHYKINLIYFPFKYMPKMDNDFKRKLLIILEHVALLHVRTWSDVFVAIWEHWQYLAQTQFQNKIHFPNRTYFLIMFVNY